jgi:hypothetical protein
MASRLSLDQYRRLCRHLPLPTSEQMEAFAEFVSEAHSWYKHLPAHPPGVAVRFFLDPSAGMQRTMDEDGRIGVEERTETGFHYSWIATQEYRRRFGFLAFALEGAPTATDASQAENVKVSSDDTAAVYNPELQRLVDLPGQVIMAGTAYINAFVHRSGSHILHRFLNWPDAIVWPEETGGEQTAEKIRARLAYIGNDYRRMELLSADDLRAAGDWALQHMDYPLYELTVPERQRQLRRLVYAMERVCKILARQV